MFYVMSTVLALIVALAVAIALTIAIACIVMVASWIEQFDARVASDFDSDRSARPPIPTLRSDSAGRVTPYSRVAV